MIQLNLLPDVKQEYIKAQRSRRLVVSVAVIACAVSIGILVFLLLISAAQAKHLSDLNKDIASDTAKLKQQSQIDKILTVQNQLQSLTALHDGKPAVSRVFDYLNQVTPAQVSINSFTIDFTTQDITIAGTADSLSSVNKYIDTLKFTTYKTDSGTSTKAFNNVVLTSFAISGSGGGSQSATYSIKFKYDPPLFDVTQKTTLIVPTVTTTRSSLDKPTDLFQPAPVQSRGN